MTEETSFPRDLLDRSDRERKDYFWNRVVHHSNLDEAFNKVMDYVHDPCGISIIQVFGPVGVGKSKLCELVKDKILADEADKMANNPGYIPVALVKTPATQRGHFDYKELWTSLLEAYDEPLISEKVEYPALNTRAISDQANPRDFLRKSKKQSNAAIYNATRNAVKYRESRLIILDEAQHAGRISSGRMLRDQMDILKSFADDLGVQVLMAGTYELLALVNLSDQLSRRCRTIHFRRYDPVIAKDIENFKRTLLSFQMFLPVEGKPNLIKYSKYIHQYTQGCVGILKTWLTEALKEAIKAGAKTVTLEHLKATALSPEQIDEIREKIETNETQLAELRKKAEANLALSRKRRPPNPAAGSAASKASGSPSNSTPGERKPGKDSTARIGK